MEQQCNTSKKWFFILDMSESEKPRRQTEQSTGKDILFLLKKELGAQELLPDELPKGVVRSLAQREILKRIN